MKKQEYEINNFLSLKLEDGMTNIYINGELFRQCKLLMLNIPLVEVDEYDEIESIDDVAEKLGWTEEGQEIDENKIPPEVMFWGHCSNLRAWAEMDYDTCVLHSNLAFPLLKKLTQAGDIKAKRVFKEEIIKRLKSQNMNVIRYLILEDYLKEFDNREKKFLIEDTSINLLEYLLKSELEHEIKRKMLQKLEVNNQLTVRKKIKDFFREKKYNCITRLILCRYFDLINKELLILILKDQKINYFQILRAILKQSPYLINNIIGHLLFLRYNSKMIKALKDEIKQSFISNNHDAIIFILKFSLIEDYFDYDREKEVKINLYRKVSKKTIALVEKEQIAIIQSLPEGEIGMANIRDRLSFIQNLKKKISDRMFPFGK